jgi:nicotinamidase-related amidase
MADNCAGVFDGRLSFGRRPALILVDVVMAYLTPGSPLYDPAFVAALAVNERLVAAARTAGIPVIFTNVVYQPGGADGGLFYRKVPALAAFQRGGEGGRFPPSLQPHEDETIVSKQYASAFFGTTLASTLTAIGVDTVVLTGFSTSGCVRATALDALQHGFLPFVVREACGDRHPGPHEANLFDLQAKYAEVVGEDDMTRLIAAHERPKT